MLPQALPLWLLCVPLFQGTKALGLNAQRVLQRNNIIEHGTLKAVNFLHTKEPASILSMTRSHEGCSARCFLWPRLHHHLARHRRSDTISKPVLST